MTTYEMALELAKRHIYYYPVASDSKSGLKDTHGFSDAVNDDSKAQEWFKDTNNNIGINLKKSHLMVVDVDMNHSGGVDGKHNLLKVFNTYGRLPDDTLIERTPHGGIHYFLSVPSGIEFKSKTSAFFDHSGIDLMCNNILIAPSTIDGINYSHVSGSYDDIKPAPKWLLDILKNDSAIVQSDSKTYRFKKYTGELLDSMVEGASQGQRNDFITRLAGSMLAVGTDAQNTYDLLSVINRNFVTPPLETKELDKIYSSIVNRELRRLKVK